MALSPDFAASERQQRHARAVAAAQQREHPAVLVVGMRGRVHDARGRLQLEELLPGAGGARVLRQRRRRPRQRAAVARHASSARSGQRDGEASHRADYTVRATSPCASICSPPATRSMI